MSVPLHSILTGFPATDYTSNLAHSKFPFHPTGKPAMSCLHCLLDGVHVPMYLELDSLSTHHSSAVITLGTDVIITVATAHGFCDIALSVAVVANGTNLVILGMDWFMLFASSTSFRPGISLLLVPLDALHDLHSLLCKSMSSHFMWTSSSSAMLATIHDHDLTSTAKAHPTANPTQLVMEHLLAGFCAKNHGTTCIKIMDACWMYTIHLSVFTLHCVTSPLILSNLNPRRDLDISAAFSLDAALLLSVLSTCLHEL
ncbi:uncharacterized protein ARMOST_20347 [Armillaria ostoyae]|uniref:Uncharacterized protein n=1 Tax=Armillaria ostoyae TaxID=47428 RepID=A0A284S732_ARMOS|nr:uncharacterized protein ARMOST_20347 [Armillaria ostoyae]